MSESISRINPFLDQHYNVKKVIVGIKFILLACFKCNVMFVLGETFPLRPPSVTTLTSTSSSITSSLPDTESKFHQMLIK